MGRTSARQVVDEAAENLTARLGTTPILGHFVMWNAQDILIDEQVLQAGLEAQDLELLKPAPIRPKTAMKRAIDQLLATSQLVRRVADTPKYSLYVIKDEFQVPGRDKLPDLDWRTELKLCWYKDEGNDPDRALAFSDEKRGIYYRPVVEKYLHSYVASDISEILRRALIAHSGISLRQQGGVYFLPSNPSNDFMLERLRAFVAWIADTCDSHATFISAFVVPQSSDGVSDLSQHVNHALKAELKKVADDVRAMEERIGSSDVSVKTITKYYNQVEQLQNKAMLYVDLVQFEASEVTEMVRDLGARCRELVNLSEAAQF